MKTQRFLAFVAAILITFFLAWGVMACAQVGIPPATVGGRDVTAPPFLSSLQGLARTSAVGAWSRRDAGRLVL